MEATKTLIVVDVQNDFCEGGALAVSGGNDVAERIGTMLAAHDYDLVVFTKDWHNPWPDTNGGHFSKEPDFVDSWPVHCVRGTKGAEFHPAIARLNPSAKNVFSKGEGRPDYSGFQGYNSQFLPLHAVLSKNGVREVDIVGIAGDYCVLQTALSAKRLGYNVNVIPDMVASVGGDEATKKAIDEVRCLSFSS